METSQTLVVPMKSKDNMVAWVKNHAKLPERIDKNEYELTRWSTTIHQVIVMETSQTLVGTNEIEIQYGSMGQESCKITRKN